ncbi:MAG: LON peptidase substrate-binding domain-containing protein [Firmicutes bacterium]|nr:LON peptidase substrate-binding domain-containing protein [Alicyclobacillaceae bacterium]MCL6496844.1 LON peptidase substrate-binding domain-containing protein [Bacillota bacterium]
MPVSRETITLPIYAAQAVIFPGMRVPLAEDSTLPPVLFEAMRQDLPVAVALARRPHPEGPELPHTIATIARVVHGTLERTSSPLALIGISRVHLLSYRHGDRYLVGQARFLPDLDEPVSPLLVEEARALGSELWSVVDLGIPHPVLPRHPEAVSYWIAQHLPLGPEERQELLELRTTQARLAKEVALLRGLLDSYRSEPMNS